MKSIIIAGMLTTLVAAIPPPVDLNQPDAGLPIDSTTADATTRVTDPEGCFLPCRNRCIKMWAIGTFPHPEVWYFVVRHCIRKCERDCGGTDEYGDAAFDFASMVDAELDRGTPKDGEDKQEKENPDMNMVD
ncbi:hypothetical protein KCU73_g5192, partial [Aureobasidium melanogenum]